MSEYNDIDFEANARDREELADYVGIHDELLADADGPEPTRQQPTAEERAAYMAANQKRKVAVIDAAWMEANSKEFECKRYRFPKLAAHEAECVMRENFQHVPPGFAIIEIRLVRPHKPAPAWLDRVMMQPATTRIICKAENGRVVATMMATEPNLSDRLSDIAAAHRGLVVDYEQVSEQEASDARMIASLFR